MQIAEANVARFTAQGGRGVVLRFGRFYAPDSDQTAAMVRAARARDPRWISAAATSVRADDRRRRRRVGRRCRARRARRHLRHRRRRAADRGRNRPTRSRRPVGRRRLWRAADVGRRRRWPSYLAASQRVSNRRFREATGGVRSRQRARGLSASSCASCGIEPALPRPDVRLMLWILAFSAFGVGVQAAFFPRSFYDDFPYRPRLGGDGRSATTSTWCATSARSTWRCSW